MEASTGNERTVDHRAALRERLRIELRLAVVVGVDRVNPRRAEFQQPADVLGRDEMPRRPQYVRAQDLTVVERFLDVVAIAAGRSDTDRPLGGRKILRLHGTEPRHDLRRRLPIWTGQVMVAKPL